MHYDSGLVLGKEKVEFAFSSCTLCQGDGFTDRKVIYNIYCPKGTKMLYVEPFSLTGGGNQGVGKDGVSWDGKAQAKVLAYEIEMLLQRGSKFRITKAEKIGDKWRFDFDLIGT
jgi:hypothetical protein